MSVNSNESAINLLHNYSQSNGLGDFFYHFELQKFFMGQSATNCFGTEGLSEILSNMNVAEEPFSYQSIYDIAMTETASLATLTSLPVNTGLICSYYSNCNSVNVLQPPPVCRLDENYIFRATKGPLCNKRVLWSFLPAADNSIQVINDTTISVSFHNDWQGQIIATLSGDCPISDTISFALQLSPDSVSLGNDRLLCSQNSFILDAGDDFKSYTWNDGSQSQYFTVTVPGTYWVAAENFCGEFFRDTIVVTSSSYSLNVSPMEEKCNTDTVKILRNLALQNYTVTPAGNYSVSASEILFWPSTTTTYTITALSPDGCTLKDTMRIIVKNSPAINLGSDTGFCAGDSLLLDAGNLFNSYSWSDGFSSAQRWVKQGGSYQVAGTFSNGCISKDTIVIYPPNPLPLINLSKNPVVCVGQTDKLTAPLGYDSYLWQDGSTLSTFSVNAPGKYFVQVTKNGCVNSDTAQITKVGLGPKNFLPADTLACYYDKLLICSNVNDPSFGYLWNTSGTAPCLEIVTPGIYSLKITDGDGCFAVEDIEIREKQCTGDIYFPNSFTPNNDNLNDFFRPKSFSRLTDYKMIIYNRWGQQVFFTRDILNGWDGKYNGMDQEQGAYTWLCEYSFADIRKTRKGTMLLIR